MALQAQNIAIVGAKLFDDTGAPPHRATVLIRSGRISGTGANLTVPPGATVIHVEGLALLPGYSISTRI